MYAIRSYYATHEKSSQAGFAAIAAYREQLAAAAPEDQDAVKREVVRSSLTFADTFPEHEKAAIVLGRITSYNVCYTKLLRYRWQGSLLVQ